METHDCTRFHYVLLFIVLYKFLFGTYSLRDFVYYFVQILNYLILFIILPKRHSSRSLGHSLDDTDRVCRTSTSGNGDGQCKSQNKQPLAVFTSSAFTPVPQGWVGVLCCADGHNEQSQRAIRGQTHFTSLRRTCFKVNNPFVYIGQHLFSGIRR